jgi:hypothetical protein
MSLIFAAALFFAQANAANLKSSNVRAMPVARTPEASTIVLKIALPKEEQVTNGPVWVQFRIDGYALGAGSSQFERAGELAISKMGQTVRVVIDNLPSFQINQPAIDPFDEATFYYDTSYKFEVPFQLKPGMHTIRMFPVRSFGESLKGDQTLAATSFYVCSEENNGKLNLSSPYIIYNEPSSHMYLEEEKPVLLDFYVVNTELSADGYKVRLTLDGTVNRTITTWQPYYIYGLSKGRHVVQLELLDSANRVVPGAFNKVQQVITIH